MRYDETTIPRHPGDLSPVVTREIEATFESYLAKEDGQVKPVYEVKAWQEDGWWLARVVAASGGADFAPLNALTQARTLARIEYMARDLITTILDVEQDTFEIEVMYDLPNGVGESL